MPNDSSHVGSIFRYFELCFTMPSTNHHLVVFTLVNVPFVLPLFLYILFLGVRQWKSGAKVSHTDFFTYNLVLIQVLIALGCVVMIVNMFFGLELILKAAVYMFFSNSSAITMFQLFACLERYTAVLHPVTYLALKSQTWTLIRNLVCAFVWLHAVLQSLCIREIDSMPGFLAYMLLGFFCSLVVVVFCNVRVLCALLRPAPGDGARGNACKRKALCTITAITGALLFKFGGDVFCLIGYYISDISKDHNGDSSCAIYFSVLWFTLPSTLVLPLLFLHRNGKLWCFKCDGVTEK